MATAAAADAGNSELPPKNVPCVKDNNQMRRLVGELLDIWCRNDDFSEIFVVSPFWQEEAKKAKKVKKAIEVIPEAHDWSDRVKQMFCDVFDGKNVKNKLKLFGRNNAICPPNVTPLSDFHAKFLAAINKRKNEVSVLLTSANFESKNISFVKPTNGYKNREIVVHVTVSLETFQEKFLKPLKINGEVEHLVPREPEELEHLSDSVPVVSWKEPAVLKSSELKDRLKNWLQNLGDSTLYLISPFVSALAVDFLIQTLRQTSSNSSNKSETPTSKSVIIVFRTGTGENPKSEAEEVKRKFNKLNGVQAVLMQKATAKRSKYFHGKVFAIVPKDNRVNVKVLVTSANFTDYHLNESNMDWAFEAVLDNEWSKKFVLDPFTLLPDL